MVHDAEESSWEPPLVMDDDGTTGVEVVDAGRELRWRRASEEFGQGPTEWRLHLSDMLTLYRRVARALLGLGMTALLVVALNLAAALFTVRVWGVSFNVLTRPAIWVVLVVALLLLGTSLWCRLRARRFRRQLLIYRSIGA